MAYENSKDWKASLPQVETAIDVVFEIANAAIELDEYSTVLECTKVLGALCNHKIKLMLELEGEGWRIERLMTLVQIAYNTGGVSLNIRNVTYSEDAQELLKSSLIVIEHFYDLTRIPF